MQPGAGRGRQDRLFLPEVTIRFSSGPEIKDYQRRRGTRPLAHFFSQSLLAISKKKKIIFCIVGDRMWQSAKQQRNAGKIVNGLFSEWNLGLPRYCSVDDDCPHVCHWLYSIVQIIVWKRHGFYGKLTGQQGGKEDRWSGTGTSRGSLLYFQSCR